MTARAYPIGVSAAVALVAAAIGWAALGGSGCQCESGRPIVFHDPLQSACGGFACAWEVLAGDVRRVTTYHVSRRGLRLEASAAALRPLPDGLVLPSTADGGAEVRLMMRCDPDATLDVQVYALSTAPPGGDAGALPEPEALVLQVALDPTTPVGAGIIRVQAPLYAQDGRPLPTTAPYALELSVTGAGACVVDELYLLEGALRRCFM